MLSTQTFALVALNVALVGCVLASKQSALAAVADDPDTLGPVFGILDQKEDDSYYFAASYVKYLESAGARVVPVKVSSSEDDLKELFSHLNGVLIPGGGQDLRDPNNDFLKTASLFFQWAVASADNGNPFPVWGTCLGFQTVSIIAAGLNSTVLNDGFDSENLPLPLVLTDAAASSHMLADANMRSILQTKNVTMNNHQAGVTPETYATNIKLNSFFNVLSTNVDRKGRAFVSTVEAKQYPIYASQWHPEKNSFEWTYKENIPHSAEAIQVTQYMANFLVDQARSNTNKFDQSDLQKQIIYNYAPTFSGKDGSGFEQVYTFDS